MAARGSIRCRQEASTLVVAQRLDVDSGPLRDLADSHLASVDPYLGTDCQRRGARPRFALPTARH
jgi:hypothetical protein